MKDSFLTVKTSDSENSGKIYLGANCDDANYLSFEKGKVVSIQNKVINVKNSDMTNIKADVDFKSEFVEKNWRYADQTEFIWTGKNDSYSTEDLLFIRDHFDKKRVFYDILEPQNHEFKQAIGIKINL